MSKLDPWWWLFVYWTLGNEFDSNFDSNATFLFPENEFQNVVREIVAIFFATMCQRKEWKPVIHFLWLPLVVCTSYILAIFLTFYIKGIGWDIPWRLPYDGPLKGASPKYVYLAAKLLWIAEELQPCLPIDHGCQGGYFSWEYSVDYQLGWISWTRIGAWTSRLKYR